MAELLTACLVICSALDSCTDSFCSERVAISTTTLAIDCLEPVYTSGVDFSVVSDKDLSYDSIRVSRCSMEQLDERDVQVLVRMGVKKLSISHSQLNSLAPLNQLANTLQTLDLSTNKIGDRLAATLPGLSQVTLLNLANNDLTRVPASVSDFVNLKLLDVSSNKLVSFDGFTLPVTLSDLTASENQISTVWFTTKLLKLRNIDLSKNQISYTKWLTVTKFPSSCQRINLKENKIAQIYPENFNFLTELKYLDLSYNKIASLGSLASINTLKDNTLNLANNPLHCNCSLAIFGKSPLWKAQRLPVCEQPSNLVGYTLKQLAETKCIDDVASQLVSGGEKDASKSSKLSPVTVVVVVGGLCCLVGVAIAAGIVSQRRRPVVIETNKQQMKERQHTPIVSKTNQLYNIMLMGDSMAAEESGTKSAKAVDQYVQRRRIDVVEAENYVSQKLVELNEDNRQLKLVDTIEVCLDQAAIETMTFEPVDVTDLCSLLVKEWPIAPCNTPMESYLGMYYEGDMEEWPMSTLNTRTCSKTNIDCLLETANDNLQNSTSPPTIRQQSPKKDYLSVGLLAPPNSVAAMKPVKSTTESVKVINTLGNW